MKSILILAAALFATASWADTTAVTVTHVVGNCVDGNSTANDTGVSLGRSGDNYSFSFDLPAYANCGGDSELPAASASYEHTFGFDSFHAVFALGTEKADPLGVKRGAMVGAGLGVEVGPFSVKGLVNVATVIGNHDLVAGDLSYAVFDDVTIHGSASLGLPFGVSLSAELKCPYDRWSLEGCHEEAALGKSWAIGDDLAVSVEGRLISYEGARAPDGEYVSAGFAYRF